MLLRQFYLLIDEIDTILDPIKSQFNKINIDDIEHIWGGDGLPTGHPIYRKIFNNLDKLVIEPNKIISKKLND